MSGRNGRKANEDVLAQIIDYQRFKRGTGGTGGKFAKL